MTNPTTEQMVLYFKALQEYHVSENSFSVGAPSGPIANAIIARLTEYDSLKTEVERLNRDLIGTETNWRRDFKFQCERAEKAEADLLEQAKKTADLSQLLRMPRPRLPRHRRRRDKP